jgi:hypothetical protein
MRETIAQAVKFNRGRSQMKRAALALAAVVTIGAATSIAPTSAYAWRGGWGPGLAGGLIAGAVIGGIASNAYAYGPYGSYGGPRYGYYGGYAPTYYGGYARPYYGGYRSAYYAPTYYGPRYRRIVRPHMLTTGLDITGMAIAGERNKPR